MNLMAQCHRSKERVLKRLMRRLQHEDTLGGTTLQALLEK